jgi:hypothetical protein
MLNDPNFKMLFKSMDKKLDKVSDSQDNIQERLAHIEQQQLDQKSICIERHKMLDAHEMRIRQIEINEGKTNWKQLFMTGSIGGAIGFVCAKFNIPIPKIFGG